MLKPVRMKYLKVLVLQSREREVLKRLGALGVMHLERTGAEASPLQSSLDNSAPIARCDAVIASLVDIASIWGQIDLSAVASDGESSLTVGAIEEKISQISKKRESFRQRIKDKSIAIDKTRAVMEGLAPFKDVEMPFSRLDGLSFINFSIGSVPTAKLGELRAAARAGVVILDFPAVGERTPIIAATGRTGRFALNTALEAASFKDGRNSPYPELTVAMALGRLEAQLKDLQEEEEELKLAERGFRDASLPFLAEAYSAAKAEKSMLEAGSCLFRTSNTVQLQGWVAAERIDEVAGEIGKASGGCFAAEALEPEDVPGKRVPVLLRHNWLLRPFSMLVEGFGTPAYNETEPTLFVAITYMVMFGMMFGDLGHGLVLLAGALAAAAVSKKQKSRDIATLVGLGGLSSMVFGLVYGSFFGLKSFHKYALWKDPLHGNPLDLMFLAVGCGVLVISIGIVLNVINRFRRGDREGAIFGASGVVGALFYWGVLGVLLKSAAMNESGHKWIVLSFAVFLPIAAWALHKPVMAVLARRNGGRDKETEPLGITFLESAIETFENILGYMAGTISFIRLAAYAMSHAAVLMATFLMADGIAKVDPTGIGSVLVIIAGNLVAILLEGMVAAIQALRLEYYEFFGKFFSGDGEEFKPFRV